MREFELKITSAPVLRSLHSISFSPEKEKRGGDPSGFDSSKKHWSCILEIPREHQF